MKLTVSVNILLNLINYLTDVGADRVVLLGILDTTEEFLSNLHNRLSADLCENIWKFAEKHTNDSCVGLHCGEKNNTAALGLINPLIQSCPDLWTALVKTSDYMNLISDAQRIIPQIKQDKLIIEFDTNEQWKVENSFGFKHVMACSFTFSVQTLNSLSGLDLRPEKAGLDHALSTEMIKEYERVLGCKVYTETKSCFLVYDKKYASYPIKTRNADLLILLEQHIIDVQKKYINETTFSNKVKQVMIANYKKETPTIKSVSRSLTLSIRNLQRKLKEEDTRFQDLLTDIKKELAESYLQNNSLSISEISFMLGYAEPAVFTRAYKKWTGIPPETARNKTFA